MRSISLETPEYATFHLGPSVEYRSSKALVLMMPIKMTDVVLKARPLVPNGPFRLRTDYHNKTTSASPSITLQSTIPVLPNSWRS